MPRVGEQYAARRRREILDAALRCFARDGFHATSMDDVISAAGLSPGVVYRWFRGKDELVAAAVGEALRGVLESLTALSEESPPPTLPEALERVLAGTLARARRDGQDFTVLAVHAWAESLRDPEIHRLVADHYGRLRDGFAELIRLQQRRGTLPADLDPEAAARPVFALLPGFVLTRLLLGEADPHDYARAVGALLRPGP